MATIEQQANQAFAAVLAGMREIDPAFGDRFLRRVRQPRYRYFHADKRAYCWTVEPARDEKGRERYSSWVSRLSKEYITPILSTRRDHARRKDAKARALKLWEGGAHK